MANTTNNAVEAVKQSIETASLPAGITVSGLTLFGVTLAEWVFIGTAMLLLCNLCLTLPKVYKAVKNIIKKE